MTALSPKITCVVNSAIKQCPSKPGFYGDGIDVVLVDLNDDSNDRKKVRLCGVRVTVCGWV